MVTLKLVWVSLATNVYYTWLHCMSFTENYLARFSVKQWDKVGTKYYGLKMDKLKSSFPWNFGNLREMWILWTWKYTTKTAGNLTHFPGNECFSALLHVGTDYRMPNANWMTSKWHEVQYGGSFEMLRVSFCAVYYAHLVTLNTSRYNIHCLFSTSRPTYAY